MNEHIQPQPQHQTTITITITNKLTLALLAWIPNSSGLETRGRGSRQRADIEGLAPAAT